MQKISSRQGLSTGGGAAPLMALGVSTTRAESEIRGEAGAGSWASAFMKTKKIQVSRDCHMLGAARRCKKQRHKIPRTMGYNGEQPENAPLQTSKQKY